MRKTFFSANEIWNDKFENFALSLSFISVHPVHKNENRKQKLD